MPPYVTADLPGTGGQIKRHVEDFIVNEVPLYEYEGVGTHCYIQIEKRGISTMETAKQIARALGRKTFDIGYAGLKDTRAVATQWFSVEHLESARARALDIPHLKIVGMSRHRNKLKVGHLAGNAFVLKVRNDEWNRAGASLDEPRKNAEAIWAVMSRRGVPNFFGPQRFGNRKDNHLLGLALVKDQPQEFANRFLGDPDTTIDHGAVLTARQLYAKGKLEEAIAEWPGHLNDQRRALVAMARGKNNPRRAVMAVDLKLKQLLVSALQSAMFNEVLTKRMDSFDRVLAGDLCWKHDNGACFAVPPDSDLPVEQARADAHEISPSGPMFGHRMTEPTDEPQKIEQGVLEQFGLTAESFAGPAGSHGGRRALRFFPKDVTIETGGDSRGPYLQLSFTLPSGSYATVVLGEIMKTDVALD
jgi:tRNA pseudouridine13 synthase